MRKILFLISILALPLSCFSQSSPGNISINYSVDAFESAKSWHYTTIEYLNNFNFGGVIARVNRAERFGKTGIQLEAEAYPVIGKKMYAYLSTSVSWDSLFPKYKAGAELYSSLGSGYEVSGGLRYIKPYGSDVFIASASFNKYWADFLVSLRPYLAFSGGDSYPAFSSTLKWFYGERGFAGITAAIGNTPDEPSTQNYENLYSLTSKSINAEVQSPLTRQLYIRAKTGFEDEEYTKDKFRGRYSAGIGFIYFF